MGRRVALCVGLVGRRVVLLTDRQRQSERDSERERERGGGRERGREWERKTDRQI